MLPALICAGIWAYNGVKWLELRNRNNRIRKRDSGDENAEKNLTIFKDCNFHYEDKRTYNYYNNCTFNIYAGGKKDE